MSPSPHSPSMRTTPNVSSLRAGVPLTRAGWALSGLTVACYAIGWGFGWVELMVVAAGGILALLAAMPFVLGRLRLDIARQLTPSQVTAGDPATATLTVTNPTRTPVGARLVEDQINGKPLPIEVAGLGPGATKTIVSALPTDKRGVVRLGPALIAKADPLGLMRREVRQADVDELWVRPRIAVLNALPVGFASDLEGSTSDSSPAGDVAFHTLRSYELGDDHRHIHWMSTARTGQLMVRHYVDNRLPHLAVLLDTDASAYRAPVDGNDFRPDFETAVEVAASLAINTMRAQQPISLSIGACQVLAPRLPKSTDDVLNELTVTSNVGMDLGRSVDELIAASPDASAVVVITGARPSTELLGLRSRIGDQRRSIFVRAWPSEEQRSASAVPGATVFDVSTLDQFATAFNRAIR